MISGRSSWLMITAVFCLTGVPSDGLSREAHIKFVTTRDSYIPGKFENGLMISWRDTGMPGGPNLNHKDPEARVKILDDAAREQAVCRVFAFIKAADASATGISIWDVSARKPGFIAVAAVYPRTNGSPVALLLYFDWNGLLLRRTVLDEQHEIKALEIGSDGNVWALNDFDPEERSRFVFAEYDRNGALIREAVRSHRQWSTMEGMRQGGQTSFGVDADKIWAWLPKTKTLILLNGNTGQTVVKHTGFPPVDKSSNLYAGQAALLPDGQLLIKILGVPPTHRRAEWFLWSDHLRWREVHNGTDRLCGMEGEEVIFLSSGKSSGERLVFQSESINDFKAGHR